MRPIPDYADLMPIQEFVEAVRMGCFIDYDGTGYYATKDGISDVLAKPSEIMIGLVDWGFTHVAWFNK